MTEKSFSLYSLIKVLKIMENLDDLFKFTADDALAVTESKKKNFSIDGLYKPTIKDEKCKDMNYRALVRFVPFINEGKVQTMVERWECFLKDVNDQNGVYVVSPKTVGKNCPMRAMSYKLYKSENAIDQANSKKINVYQQWYAIVEIINDEQHPEYEGKHFVYQFGSKIHDKIEDAMRGSAYEDAINPFDFFNAPCFAIDLKKDPKKKMNNGSPVTNYDSCAFIKKTSPIHFGDGMTLGTDIESKKAFMEWLENGAPKISNFFFKEWDAELTEKVNTNLASFVTGFTAPKSTVTKAQEIVNEIDETDEPTPSPKSSGVTLEVEDETDETEVSGEDDAWVDSILNS